MLKLQYRCVYQNHDFLSLICKNRNNILYGRKQKKKVREKMVLLNALVLYVRAEYTMYAIWITQISLFKGT